LKLIDEIENELVMEGWPEAIVWVDKHYSNAWSIAIDRFDNALVKFKDTKNWNEVQVEGQIYKLALIELLRRYKSAKGIDDTEAFLDSLGEDY
jgi:hypothetical protein